MSEREVVVLVSPKGDVKVEVRGCPGPDCRNLSESIEKALGKPIGFEPTMEMYEAPQTAENRQDQEG